MLSWSSKTAQRHADELRRPSGVCSIRLLGGSELEVRDDWGVIRHREPLI